jgi:hypothetical protein
MDDNIFLRLACNRGKGDQWKKNNISATKVVLDSPVDLILSFHEDNNLDIYDDIAFVTVSMFDNNEKYLDNFVIG